LAVRQAVRRQPALEKISKAQIPVWQDAAVRGLLQDAKGPLFIAADTDTKLDELATRTYFATPDDVARLGFAVAQLLADEAPSFGELPEATLQLAQQIAETLGQAKNPLIISGTSSGSEAVLKAAANVEAALAMRGNAPRLVLTVPECNSLGLALLGGHRLESGFEAVLHGYADTVIVLENDLYRRAPAAAVTRFLKAAKQVIVLDHLHNATSEQAGIVLSAGAFAEADGTLINNEGRAQRFYQVYPTAEEIQESWRWLLQLGAATNAEPLGQWTTYQELLQAMVQAVPALRGLEAEAPPTDFRIAGQKIAREPHRYSGRTAMRANISVSEPKPPEDPDSPFSFTMEGYRGQPPSALIPFFWAPGWNSVQSTNKYQDHVGGHLRGGDPGVRLLEPQPSATPPFFTSIPESFQPLAGHLLVLPRYHIFGSEELSAHGPAIRQRMPVAYVALNADDARRLKVKEGELLDFTVGEQSYQLPVRLSAATPTGTAGLPVGLPGVPFAELPAWAILNRDVQWKPQAQVTY
jgi:NADH-quinone oxidoreductase subunit G